jgi:2,3-bisphosphoglycerate-dependent phosphoglycerate mutase
MKRTRLTIVRHGETEWNVAMRLQGMQNSSLTKNGLRQTRLVAKALRTHQFNILISSDLGRAVKTAEIINKYHHLEVITDSDLRERNFGIMEGLTREQIQDIHPEVFNGYMDRKDTYSIPQGESLIEFYTRVTSDLKRIAKTYEGKEILVVSHGGVLDCTIRMVFNYPLSAPRHFSIYNASVNSFLITGNDWYLEQWGNIDHQKINSISLDELKR